MTHHESSVGKTIRTLITFVGIGGVGYLGFLAAKSLIDQNAAQQLKVLYQQATLNAPSLVTPGVLTSTPEPTPLPGVSPVTPTPEAPFPAFNRHLATVPQFSSGEQVANLRGGDPSKWVLKAESNNVTYTDGNLQSVTETRAKGEWVYTGDQKDLKYPMPQSEDEAAQMFGIDRSNIILIRITHDKTSNSYSPWMDKWPVSEGIVVGIHFIENHGTQIAAYDGNQKIKLPPGWTMEMYDDRQTANDLDNVSAVLYNDGDSTMSVITSGATLWSMANPEALQLEQANQGITATDHYIYNGKQINNLRSASNFASPITATYIVELNSDGRLVIVGFNIPGKGIISLDSQSGQFNREKVVFSIPVKSATEILKESFSLAAGTGPARVTRPQALGKGTIAFQKDQFRGRKGYGQNQIVFRA